MAIHGYVSPPDNEPEISAHRVGPMIWIDMMHVPEHIRGKGIGKQFYAQWEARLPKDIQYIRLVPVDSGSGLGPADRFWEMLGFDYLYTSKDHDVELPHDMVKGVNGHKPPGPFEYEPELEEEIKMLKQRAGLL